MKFALICTRPVWDIKLHRAVPRQSHGAGAWHGLSNTIRLQDCLAQPVPFHLPRGCPSFSSGRRHIAHTCMMRRERKRDPADAKTLKTKSSFSCTMADTATSGVAVVEVVACVMKHADRTRGSGRCARTDSASDPGQTTTTMSPSATCQLCHSAPRCDRYMGCDRDR